HNRYNITRLSYSSQDFKKVDTTDKTTLVVWNLEGVRSEANDQEAVAAIEGAKSPRNRQTTEITGETSDENPELEQLTAEQKQKKSKSNRGWGYPRKHTQYCSEKRFIP
ncbi:hypothetical protein HAX54_039694, partial [Datura stramonium]|nr:hypothetical protein [Datura stramonium]